MTALDKITQKIENIPIVLAEFEDEIAEDVIEEHLRLKGKLLQKAAAEQASWQFYYATRKAEMYAVVKWLEGKLAAVRGNHFKLYTENYNRQLTDRQKDKYIDNEEDVLNQLQLYLTFKELHDKYEAVVDAFRSQGFMIRHLTEIRIRSLEDTIID